LRALTKEHGMLFVVDEVQSGMGRTGKMFASEHFDLDGDIVNVAKGIASGLPLGVTCARADIMAWPPGAHASTFGGNPVSCAAAAVVLDTVADEAFRARAEELGRSLRARLDELASRHHVVGEVRGLGPMRALELRERSPDAAKAVTEAAFDAGLLLLACGLYGNVLRLLPPLTVTDDELERGLELLDRALAAA
jgi:4-aminobutyrate aminotransferase-like enzyme